MRLLYLLETLVIAAAVLLGTVWPSAYTIIGLLVLPGAVMAVIGVLRPVFFAGRRWAQRYIHLCAVLSLLAVVTEAVWLSRISAG
jgi:hypothetical protein